MFNKPFGVKICSEPFTQTGRAKFEEIINKYKTAEETPEGCRIYFSINEPYDGSFHSLGDHVYYMSQGSHAMAHKLNKIVFKYPVM